MLMLRKNVIRQKGESQKGVSRKQSTPNFQKTNIAYQGVRNVCFSEILACFAFMKHPF